jgi:hypothetical protein
MQIKMTLRVHLTSVIKTIIKKTNNKCWQAFREKETIVRGWWECKINATTLEISMQVPQKTKNRTATRSYHITRGHVSEGL